MWQRGARANEASGYSLHNESVIIEEPSHKRRSAFPMMTQSEHEGEDSYSVRVDMNKEYQKHKRALCMLKSLKDVGF